MSFSVIIPARNEQEHLPACLESLAIAAKQVDCEIEIIVVLNRCTDKTENIAKEFGCIVTHCDDKNLSRIRNRGAELASKEFLITIDADSRVSKNMLSKVAKALNSGEVIGGGVAMYPDRWSLGIIATGICIAPVALWHRISAGLFFCHRETFIEIGGFDENYVSAEDVEFALRLKHHGKTKAKKFKTILNAHIITSTRKFDTFGDWHYVKNIREFYSLLAGTNQALANKYWYDVNR